MTITSLVVVVAGKEVSLVPNDILVVQASFQYRTPVPVDVTLWASLGIGLGRDIESFMSIHLEATTTTETWTGTTEILIPSSGKANGTYWMKVEIDGEEVTISNAVVISNMETAWGVIEMIPLLITVMIMSMLMNMMTSPEGFMATGAKYVEKGKEVAAPVIKIFAGRGKTE